MRALCSVVLLAIAAPALAQQAVEGPQDEKIDEVIVPGRAEPLYVEIERLENDVYERFNALNGNDDFDIYCRMRPPTGSNIPLRWCAPKFVIDAEGEGTVNSLVDARSGGADARNDAEHRMRMEQKSRDLTAEMQRVAREDEQLLRDLVRLDELRQLQASAKDRRGSR
jgi:hypothetical protein